MARCVSHEVYKYRVRHVPPRNESSLRNSHARRFSFHPDPIQKQHSWGDHNGTSVNIVPTGIFCINPKYPPTYHPLWGMCVCICISCRKYGLSSHFKLLVPKDHNHTLGTPSLVCLHKKAYTLRVASTTMVASGHRTQLNCFPHTHVEAQHRVRWSITIADSWPLSRARYVCAGF